MNIIFQPLNENDIGKIIFKESERQFKISLNYNHLQQKINILLYNISYIWIPLNWLCELFYFRK